MGRSIMLGLCFFTIAFGMEDVNDVTYHKVKSILEEHLENNPGLLDSSKGKDIIVFLGNTGSGKSTLINYLSEKELRADDFNNILLANIDDPSAMAIGEGGDSETFLPRFIPVGDLLFYDMPGFNDTRGTARNLVNACFIKSIIENARSARLVFVVGSDEITAKRGDSIIELLKNVKQLVPNKPVENFSGLIVTKSQVSKIALPDFIDLKLPLEWKLNPNLSIVSQWIDHQRIDQISMPRDRQINYDNRGSILQLIGEMGYEQIENIDIGVIYDVSQQRDINLVYDAEIENIIERVISQNGCGLNLISGHTPRFMGESPTLNSLGLINLGELGIFCEGDKLYGKVRDKQTIEVQGLSQGSFDRITRSLKDAFNIEGLNVVLQREKGHKQTFAAFNDNIAYESTTLSDLEALLQFTSSCGYTTLDKGTLENKKNYIVNGFNQSLSLSLAQSPLIKLLRPISEGIYQSSWHTRSQNLTIRIQNIVALLNEEIARKESQEAEVRRIQAEQERQAEEMRRIQAERQRQAEEARRIQAEQQVAAAEAAALLAQQQAAAAQAAARLAQQQAAAAQAASHNKRNAVEQVFNDLFGW